MSLAGQPCGPKAFGVSLRVSSQVDAGNNAARGGGAALFGLCRPIHAQACPASAGGAALGRAAAWVHLPSPPPGPGSRPDRF